MAWFNPKNDIFGFYNLEVYGFIDYEWVDAEMAAQELAPVSSAAQLAQIRHKGDHGIIYLMYPDHFRKPIREKCSKEIHYHDFESFKADVFRLHELLGHPLSDEEKARWDTGEGEDG